MLGPYVLAALTIYVLIICIGECLFPRAASFRIEDVCADFSLYVRRKEVALNSGNPTRWLRREYIDADDAPARCCPVCCYLRPGAGGVALIALARYLTQYLNMYEQSNYTRSMTVSAFLKMWCLSLICRSLNAARLFNPWTFASRAKWSPVWRVFHRVEDEEELCLRLGRSTTRRSNVAAVRAGGMRRSHLDCAIFRIACFDSITHHYE